MKKVRDFKWNDRCICTKFHPSLFLCLFDVHLFIYIYHTICVSIAICFFSVIIVLLRNNASEILVLCSPLNKDHYYKNLCAMKEQQYQWNSGYTFPSALIIHLAQDSITVFNIVLYFSKILKQNKKTWVDIYDTRNIKNSIDRATGSSQIFADMSFYRVFNSRNLYYTVYTNIEGIYNKACILMF